MTSKEVIENAKNLFNKDITEAQAMLWLAEHPNDELTEEDLNSILSGSCTAEAVCPFCGSRNTLYSYACRPDSRDLSVRWRT